MSFHDTPQQPLVQPAAFRPERSRRDRANRRGASCIRLARAIRRANRAGANARPRPHANARGKGSLRCRAGAPDEREPNEGAAPMSFPDPCPSFRQEVFRKCYHDKTRVNMSFHDTPQQPVQPASSRTARSSPPRRACGPTPVQPTGEVRPASASRGQSGARTAPAPTRARARPQMRAIKGLRCRAGAPDEHEPNQGAASYVLSRSRRRGSMRGATARNNPFNPTGKARVAPDHDKT